MKSKYKGVCPLCQNKYDVGDEIWWEKGRTTICIACHGTGAKGPTKDGAVAVNVTPLVDIAKRILDELMEIKQILRVGDATTVPDKPFPQDQDDPEVF